MRTRRWIRYALAPVLAATGLAVSPSPAAAAPADLHVNRARCSSGADGTPAKPFCAITAALAVAEPGQTVLVHAAVYGERVTFTRSGTESAPITVRAVNNANLYSVIALAGGMPQGPVLDFTGVHDIVVEGFHVIGFAESSPIVVHNASRITLDRLSTRTALQSAVRVTGTSSRVTVSRGWFPPGGVSIEGARDTVVTANTFRYSQLTVADAPGTTIVGNTVVTSCKAGITVSGASTGVDLRNNIVRTALGLVPVSDACPTPSTATAITVAATVSATADYNLIDPSSGGALYRWADTDHSTLESFRTATGQGAHDLAAPAGLAVARGTDRGWFPLAADSPAIDSADGTAPGVTATDLLDNAHVDVPSTANTGTGNGFHDRGAVELLGSTSYVNHVRRKAGGHPYDVEAQASIVSSWPTDGPVGKVSGRFPGAAMFESGRSRSAAHRFRVAGPACAEHHISLIDFRIPYGSQNTQPCTVLGARYTAVAPTRLLDTRDTSTPIEPGRERSLGLPTVNGVAPGDITAAVFNVTVTRPTTAGHLTVHSSVTGVPNTSNVNFVAGETVANLVTVPVTNGSVNFYNGGPGTVHVVADLQGYYAASGQGFRALSPVRVLDSRTGAPLAAQGSRVLDLTGRIPADATAAIVNLTATRPTAAGHLTAHADGTAVPTASNLNFVAGQTIPNLAIVPVADGKARIHNHSTGTTHVVADLNGWFGPGGTDSFVPFGPQRTYDTRPGAPQGPFIGAGVNVQRHPSTGDGSAPVLPTATVMNVTVNRPTAPGHLVAYPGGLRPDISNVNFAAGETAANHAIVMIREGGSFDVLNASDGHTHVIIDQFGYFATF